MPRTAIIEWSKIYNSGESQAVRAIEGYFAEIAKKLHPERDWTAQPIEFCLSDENVVNASIYAGEKPPVVVISKKVLDFVESEDELAFIIGHELGHDTIKKYVGDTFGATKGEEGSADVIATRRLIKAGYRPDAGISFFRRLQKEISTQGKENVFGVLAQPVLDPHPNNGNRIIAVETALSHASIFEHGKLDFKEAIALSPIARQNLGDARHLTFIERWLPADYSSWSATRKLRHMLEGFSQIINDERDPVDLRLHQILEVVRNIRSDSSDEYWSAANSFISVAERHDRLNKKYRFDSIYRAVAQTFNVDDKQLGLVALGPFVEWAKGIEEFSSLSPGQESEIKAHAESILTLFGQMEPYYNKDDLQGRSTRETLRNSDVIRSLSISHLSRQPALSSLYVLASTPQSAKAIWMLGGAYDEKFWEVIGPEVVQSLMNVRPFAGTTPYGHNSSEDRNKSFDYLQAEIGPWIRQRRKSNNHQAPKTITEYVELHEDDLFPMGGQALTYVLNNAHPEAEKFKDFVTNLFSTADDEARQSHIKELENFYAQCSQWLGRLGKQTSFHASDRVYKYSSPQDIAVSMRKAADGMQLLSSNFGRDVTNAVPLPEDHPYVQILLSEQFAFDASFRSSRMGYITIPEQISMDNARKLFGVGALQTVRDCLDAYTLLERQDKFGSTRFRTSITNRGLLQVLQSKSVIGLSDQDLIALSSVVPDNEVFRDYANSIITKDLRDMIVEKVWNDGADKKVAATLEKISMGDVVQLYRFLDRNRLFPTPKERAAVGDVVLEKIRGSSPDERLATCEKILLRAPGKTAYSSPDDYVTANLALRDELIKIWQSELVRANGIDTGLPEYKSRVGNKIDEVIKFSVARDRDVLLVALADGLEIQDGLSEKIKQSIKPTAETLRETHIPIAGAEILFGEIERNETLRLAFIGYLSEPLSRKTLDAVTVAVKQNKFVTSALAQAQNHSFRTEVNLTAKEEQTLESKLDDIHTHFGYLSLEQRATILSALLVPGEKRLDEKSYSAAYNNALQLVLDKVFPNSAENASDAKTFVSAYLKMAASHERMAFLSGALAVSVERDPSAQASTAVQAVKIMSALGPAYVKLGQAINSHPQCPDDWRRATDGLKSEAATEPRWELVLKIKEKWKNISAGLIEHFGPILGSASFNTALSLRLRQETGQTTDAVALLERPNAAVLAEAGFEHLANTVVSWDSPVARRFGNTLGEMLEEARQMASEETSRELGDSQYSKAQELYRGRQIRVQDKSGGIVVNVTPVDNMAATEGLRVVSEAHGVYYTQLPETSVSQKLLKHMVAKAYVSLEMHNILSGNSFDCDRHGKQMKVVVQDGGVVSLNLYDFGGMGLAVPTDSQKQALGKMLNAVASGIMIGKEPEAIIAASIEQTTNSENRQYLMRVRKAWLALSDYMRDFDGKQDYIDVLKAVLNEGIDPVIQREMPTLSMLNFIGAKADIRIGMGENVSESLIPTGLPTVEAKRDDSHQILPNTQVRKPDKPLLGAWWPWGKGKKLICG